MLRIFLSCILIFNLISFDAKAQNFTAEGAEQIKAEIQDWVETQIKLMNMSEVDAEQAFTPITTEGQVTVTPENGYYAAKLPFVTLALDLDRRIEIGQIAMNIVPDTDNPDIWGMTMAMPKSMPIVNNVGDTLGSLNIGSQRFKGRIDTSRDIFLQYEMAYADIYGEEKSENEQNKFTLKIDRINGSQDLQPMVDTPELYSGPMDYSASGIEGALIEENRSVKLNIQDMTAKTQYAQIPLFDAEGFQNDVLQYTNPDSGMTDKDLATKVFEAMRYLPNNAKSSFVMNKLSVISDDEEGQNKMLADQLQFTSFGEGLKSDDANMGVSYKISGLDFEGLPESYEPYLPYLSKFNAEIQSLPILGILELLETGTTGALDENSDMTDEQRAQLMDMTLKMIAPLLVKHETKFVIYDSETVAPDFALTMSGDLVASGASPRGYIGDVFIQIKGLDDAVNALRETMRENEGSRIFLQQVVQGLSMVQIVGDLDTTQNTRTYKFEFDEAGDVYVNGTNFGAFMGSMAH